MSTLLPNTPRLRATLAVADALLLGAAGWLAHAVRFSAAWRRAKLDLLLGSPGFLVVGALTLWALALAAELYEPVVLRRRRELAARVAATACGWSVAIVIAMYLVPSWQFGRGLMVLTAAGWAVGAWVVRRLVQRRLAHRPRAVALLVGAEEEVARACARLAANPLSPWRPVDGSALAMDEVADQARAQGAEVVLVVGGERSPTSARALADLHFSGVPVVAASEAWAWLEGRLPISELSPATFLHQPGFGAVHWKLFNRITRVLDVVLAMVLLVLCAPLLFFAALAVLIFDGRPVLYRQVRVGQFGRPFKMVKLRTMQRDAERAGPAFARPEDPRVTRVGRVLRRLRIDELTQLVHVLRGEMSLVGPRPERPEFVAELSEQIPYYTFRLAVPPGVTGWAQVNMASAVTVEEHRRKLEYDLYFIRERSVGLYVLTLLRTVSAALAGPGR